MNLESLLNHLEALVSQAFKRKRKGSGARRWTDIKVRASLFRKKKRKHNKIEGRKVELSALN